MSIKLDTYRIFVEVAKWKSFSKAAKNLYITQPAISQAINQLEKELGTRLFTRTPRGVVLTNEGHVLFEYASSAINLIDVGVTKLLESKKLMVGVLRIGVGDTISRYYLLPYLEKFHKEHPNIKLKIINRTTFEICDLLKFGEVDIGICNLPVEDADLRVEKLINIQDIFVCGEGYRHLLKKPLSFSHLAELPLILLEPISNSRQYVENYILSKGVKIEPEIELGSHDLLLEFAKINLGISCVVKEFSKDYLDKKIVYELKLEEKIPQRQIGACYLKTVTLSPAAMKFLEYLSPIDN
ncbi:MAG: LysR family transcriptional regulator [Tissierellia bacterium]|nr:LysR family transcriptional regulator [Tissierellia bacterium]